MSNKSLVICLCVLLILEVGISVYLWIGRQKEITRSQIMIESIDKLASENQFLRRNIIIQEEIKAQKVNIDEIITNRLGEQMHVGNILKNPYNHILYIPYNSCSSCNQNILNNISDLIDLYDNELFIFCSSSDINSITLYSNHKTTPNTLFFYSDVKSSNDYFFDLAPYILTVGEHGDILFIRLLDDNNMNLAKDLIKLHVIRGESFPQKLP